MHDTNGTNGTNGATNGTTGDETTTLEFTNGHLKHLLKTGHLFNHLFQDITIKSATPGKVILSLTLEPKHLNSKGALHGSVNATLVDFMGGLAIASYDNRSNTGVSTDVHLSFVGQAREGEVIEIEGTAEKVGGTLGFVRVIVRKVVEGKPEGKIMALGSQTNYVKFGTS